jgi:hypothetical protein
MFYLADRGKSLLGWTGELILLLDAFLGVKGDKAERESSEVLNIFTTFEFRSSKYVRLGSFVDSREVIP